MHLTGAVAARPTYDSPTPARGLGVTPNFKDKLNAQNSCVPRNQSHTQADKLQ